MQEIASHVVNVDEVEETSCLSGEHWGGHDKLLTPSMRPKGGKLGMSRSRLPQGRSMCPFHYHQLEDEIFFVLSGRGVLRYGDDVRELRVGDCVSCPAGTKVAHQICNPFEEELVYLTIGPHEPEEVAVYPDNGKVLIRGLGLERVGVVEERPYFAGEPERPRVFELAERAARALGHVAAGRVAAGSGPVAGVLDGGARSGSWKDLHAQAPVAFARCIRARITILQCERRRAHLAR